MADRAANAADNVVGLYERQAELWDRLRGRSLFERIWLDRFLALVPKGGSVLDLGCGSGEPIARYFIECGHPVTGVDSSESLIAFCRRRFPDQQWLLADMRQLDLGMRFDGLVAWDSFFHLPPAAQRPMFSRFAQHVRLGGVLMFTSGPRHGDALGAFGGETLYHGSLAPEEYKALLGENGFDVLRHTVEDPDCGGHTIWLAALRRVNCGD